MSPTHRIKQFSPSERRAFKQLIRPLLEEGLTHREIADRLNAEGHTLPGLSDAKRLELIRALVGGAS